tara:strand:- start:190 stop:297 length:108 start_codon:yes stop_codon:yes gene_type:complete
MTKDPNELDDDLENSEYDGISTEQEEEYIDDDYDY